MQPAQCLFIYLLVLLPWFVLETTQTNFFPLDLLLAQKLLNLFIHLRTLINKLIYIKITNHLPLSCLANSSLNSILR